MADKRCKYWSLKITVTVNLCRKISVFTQALTFPKPNQAYLSCKPNKLWQPLKIKNRTENNKSKILFGAWTTRPEEQAHYLKETAALSPNSICDKRLKMEAKERCLDWTEQVDFNWVVMRFRMQAWTEGVLLWMCTLMLRKLTSVDINPVIFVGIFLHKSFKRQLSMSIFYLQTSR